jgi:hypothetical protein
LLRPDDARDRWFTVPDCQEQRMRDGLQAAECRIVELKKDLQLAQQAQAIVKEREDSEEASTSATGTQTEEV